MRFSKKYSMKKSAADATLQNVFAACNEQPSTKSFDILILRSLAQTTLVSTLKWIATGFLFLVLVAPIALMDSDFTVNSRGVIRDKVIIEEHRLYEHTFILRIHGDEINYDNIYAIDTDGRICFPSAINRENGLIEFPYNNKGMTINIPCYNGQVVTATLSAGSTPYQGQ